MVYIDDVFSSNFFDTIIASTEAYSFYYGGITLKGYSTFDNFYTTTITGSAGDGLNVDTYIGFGYSTFTFDNLQSYNNDATNINLNGGLNIVYLLYNNIYGDINFSSPIGPNNVVNELTFGAGQNIDIQDNNISLNSANLPELNVSAIL
jgi:hypothetical protein